MIIGAIVFIFCILGVYGYFNSNIFLTYLGLILAVAEHIWGITSGQQKGFSTGWLAVICAIGMTCSGNNLLESIAICMCFENVIVFGLGVILFVITGVAMKNAQKNNIKNTEIKTEKTPAEIYYEKEIEKNLEKDFEKLLDTIKAGSGVNDLEDAIETFFEFYMKKGIKIPSVFLITDNRTKMQKYENLLHILELGIGVKGIDNVQKSLSDFYALKSNEIDEN